MFIHILHQEFSNYPFRHYYTQFPRPFFHGAEIIQILNCDFNWNI
jgi:hypothetical protein